MKKEYLIYKLSDQVKHTCKIDNELFSHYGVKRGLRNEDGSGVLVGLTNIGNVVGYDRDKDGNLLPAEGKLYYRGYELNDLVSPLLKEQRFGFEETAYLLLSGKLPDREELTAFRELLNENMALDHRTVVHLVDLKGTDIMNILARCVLEMYT
ncbi:MAG: citrate synthase, partial [Prevotella sp.]|nr:citrate synthase [Prevotella sp.]